MSRRHASRQTHGRVSGWANSHAIDASRTSTSSALYAGRMSSVEGSGDGGGAGMMPGTRCGYFMHGRQPVGGQGYLDGGPQVSARQSVLNGPACSPPQRLIQRALPSAICLSIPEANSRRTAGKKLRYSRSLYTSQVSSGPAGGPRKLRAQGHHGAFSLAIPWPQKPPHAGVNRHGSLANLTKLAAEEKWNS